MVALSLHKFEPPRPEDWEADDLHIEELQQLALAIDRDMPDERMDARAIARFQTGLIQFMESALGPNSMPPRPFPKLPFTWIDDNKTNGTLRDVIMKCYQLKEGKGLKSLEWRDLQQRMALLDILSVVRNSFEKNGFAVTPTVYFDKSVPEAEVTELSGFVVKMKGKVVTDRNAVGLTHIVYPFGPNGDPDDGEEYMRTQRKRGTKALVHRWYTPDSHNSWVDLSVAPEQVENDAEHLLSGPAKVYVRWVRDSRRYNEWMNIVDYETDEGNEDHEKYKKELEQRGFTPGQFLERMRRARQAGGANKTQMFQAEQEVDPNFREEIAEGVVRRHVRFTNKRIKEGLAQSENISWGQMAKVYDGADATAAMAHVGLPRELTTLPAPAADAHVRMPVYAHWFRMASVHEIERNANVEFFNGRSSIKTPEKYVEYRNFMVERYRKCPQARLTFLDCRMHLVGDVNAIRRVWTFLDSWGLINFEADPVPVLDEPMEVLTVDDSGEKPQQVRMIRPGQVTMRTPTPQAVLSLPVVTPEKAVLLATSTNDADGPLARIGADTSLLTKKDTTNKAPGKDEQTGGKLQFFCNAMPWVDCTACRFHCMKLPDIDLCPQAFAEGRFPPGTCSKDFIKIDTKAFKSKGAGWSDQEHLLLLEGIELFGENFDKVAEHVGTKNQLDCIMQFLQMPIDEECVNTLRNSTVSRGAMCIQSPSAVARRDFPFSREENPLASQLIFLAEVVGAKIAASAASAAMQELFEKDSVVHQELLHSAAVAAGMQVPAPQPAAAGAAGAVGTDASGAAPMDVDGPTVPSSATPPAANGSANGVNGHVNENVVRDIAAAIASERLHAASAAAFLGAGTKAKMLAEAEGVLLSGHAMTVLECMTQKMVVKNKYLNDVENEISSVHAKLVGSRVAALKSRDSIAEKKEALKKEKQLLAAAEKKHRAELEADGNGAAKKKNPAAGELPEGAAKKVAKPADTTATASGAPAVATAAAPAAAPNTTSPGAVATAVTATEATAPAQAKNMPDPAQDAAAKQDSSGHTTTQEEAQPGQDDGPQPMDIDSSAERPKPGISTEPQQIAAQKAGEDAALQNAPAAEQKPPAAPDAPDAAQVSQPDQTAADKQPSAVQPGQPPVT